MKVSPDQPFILAYSLYEHQFLGHLFETFVVALDDNGSPSLRFQNISSMNAHEFGEVLDDTDHELIATIDEMQQEAIIRKFFNKKAAPNKFFSTIYDGEAKHEGVRQEIGIYLEKRRAKILEKLPGKNVFEMGNDGNPAYRKIEVQAEKATIRFRFWRNEENTHYRPTILHNGEKLVFQYRNGIIICNEPAWLMVDGKLYGFQGNVDGKKIKPFLRKNFIAIPKSMEETYYRKFVTPLLENYDVKAEGFTVEKVKVYPSATLYLSEIQQGASQKQLFGESKKPAETETKICLQLAFSYRGKQFTAPTTNRFSVNMRKEGDEYHFERIMRHHKAERETLEALKALELPLSQYRVVMDKQEAFSWVTAHKETLAQQGIETVQSSVEGRRYFMGKPSIKIDISEAHDWFDIKAQINFGEFEIPFAKIRKLIVQGKHELPLPNGEIAIIPTAWFSEYADLFQLSHLSQGEPRLHKHHLAMVQELKAGKQASVALSGKLEQLRDFSQMDDFPLSENFKGSLRPYQKAGYNWMRFLKEYRFGGCLADDMGLGKTVQTLAMLQHEQDANPGLTSLLVMPTSLLYNWQKEAKRFVPKLKVLLYTGTDRDKSINYFQHYDLVLTSYGIVRLDIDILKGFYFNYAILDESQAIKNPSSATAQAVQQLRSKQRLILTGTPIENTTLDLWSQMNFANPGLLGAKPYFRKEYQLPIEKKQSEAKQRKLHSIIKPFVLRRHKSQVAKDLPEKIENIQYVGMTPEQEREYEEAKSKYRNKIMDLIETSGLGKSQLILLQGLTVLRQLANHPKMVSSQSESGSGKMEDMLHMLTTAISEGHKILVFSQFVKYLQIVEQALTAEKIPYAYLDGSTKDRQAQVDQFQQNERLRVFLISLKAGGLGLNLTAADYVFILDPWWNPAVEAQAIDRAHRIGQQNTVFTYKFITRNTVEEKILDLQQSKKKLAEQLITTEQSFVKQLSKDDIDALLS